MASIKFQSVSHILSHLIRLGYLLKLSGNCQIYGMKIWIFTVSLLFMQLMLLFHWHTCHKSLDLFQIVPSFISTDTHYRVYNRKLLRLAFYLWEKIANPKIISSHYGSVCGENCMSSTFALGCLFCWKICALWQKFCRNQRLV